MMSDPGKFKIDFETEINFETEVNIALHMQSCICSTSRGYMCIVYVYVYLLYSEQFFGLFQGFSSMLYCTESLFLSWSSSPEAHMSGHLNYLF